MNKFIKKVAGLPIISLKVIWMVIILYMTHLFYRPDYSVDDNYGYVPKSQRGRAHNLIKVLNRKVERVTHQVSKWIVEIIQTPRGTNKKRSRYRYHAYQSTSPSPKRRSNRCKAMATAILAMQASAEMQNHRQTFDTDSKLIGVDNRCSYCISPYETDFVGPLTTITQTIEGFNGAVTQEIRRGTLVLEWADNNGQVHKFRIPGSYCIPTAKQRLLSPQHWAKTQKDPVKRGTGCETFGNQTTLFWDNRKYELTIQHSAKDNCATFQSATGYKQFHAYCAKLASVIEREDTKPLLWNEIKIYEPSEIISNDIAMDAQSIFAPLASRRKNETESPENDRVQLIDMDLAEKYSLNNPNNPSLFQMENMISDEPKGETDEALLLQYHQRFGHIGFERLKLMAKANIIPRRLMKARVPACSACMFAKATRRPWRGKPSTKFDVPKATAPGERVHVDQLESPTLGLIAQMTGKLTLKRYKYATVYVDAYSKLGYIYLQKSNDKHETLEGKLAFELYAKQRGVQIKSYHADNGVFRSHTWQDDCANKRQGCTFTPVGAHFDNGHAEKRIRDLQDLARTMLIHAANRWPKAITANLWPYALRMANQVINETPNPSDEKGRSADQIFSSTETNINPKHYMPFGCPVYVLDSQLQAQQPFHKWRDRSKVGIYLGQSPIHSRNVALVLDRNTGLVSPQFHVKMDPQFDTVKQENWESMWQLKAGFTPQRENSGETPKVMVIPPLEGVKTPQKEETNPPLNQNHKRLHNNTQSDVSKRQKIHTDDSSNHHLQARSDLVDSNSMNTSTNTSKVGQEASARTPDGSANPSIVESPAMEPEIKNSEGETPDSQNTPILIQARLMSKTLSEISSDQDIQGELFCLETIFPNWSNDSQDEILLAYKATIDPDTMYLHEARKEDDWEEFRKAMQSEVEERMKLKNFSIIHRSQVPKGATILPAVWQLKRKRDIRTKEIKKYKARLNIDGSRMVKGEHYDETYAPVASWNSIRILLAMAAVNNWHTRQLDYVGAFPQAPVERDLYMEIPKGVQVEGANNSDEYVLKVHKNLYGQKQAGRVWNKYLVRKLQKIGFQQSSIDECVFYRNKTLYVLYTDDSLLAGPDEKEIEKIIDDMKRVKLDITVEGDIQDFLGVNINMKDDGTVHLVQPHLIDSILKDLNLSKDNVKTKDIPAASSKLLRRYQDEPDYKLDFNYRSVIGKLNYLERGSRSDIAYAVHQCARFSSNPKKAHSDAVKWLGRYLKSTRDKGTIFHPDKNKGLEVFVDADFAGNFDKSDPHRDTARSRHGYYIMLYGCPIIWKSQLQTEIALSSTESEYNGLSYALREAIPVIELLKEMKSKGLYTNDDIPQVKCRVFEDNSGALEIAKNHKYRPRTKHLNNKLHHFRDYVSRGEIEVVKINTKDQIADILTKPVPHEILIVLRKKAIGW